MAGAVWSAWSYVTVRDEHDSIPGRSERHPSFFGRFLTAPVCASDRRFWNSRCNRGNGAFPSPVGATAYRPILWGHEMNFPTVNLVPQRAVAFRSRFVVLPYGVPPGTEGIPGTFAERHGLANELGASLSQSKRLFGKRAQESFGAVATIRI